MKVPAEAIERLLSVARSDTGQSRKAASFLLAWWNGETCGGFDLTDLWGLDKDLNEAACQVFLFVASSQHYPGTLGYGPQFERIVAIWRPHLVNRY